MGDAGNVTPATAYRTAGAAAIAEAAALLAAGALVAFPTETVYGLGANALDAAAVQRIFMAKGRPATNPVIVHTLNCAAAQVLTTNWPEAAEKLANAFWPGPLTLVLPKAAMVPDVVTAGGPTVAVRVPRHPVALALLRETRFPLAAPSANRSTELSPTRAEHVFKSLNGRIAMILDGGPCEVGLESTVVDVTDGVRVLRPGMITVPMLEAVVGKVESSMMERDIARSPGQMLKHYSPRTPVRLANTTAEAMLMAKQLKHAMTLQLDADPRIAAETLYATLHEHDDLNLDAIIVVLPPDTPAWAAIRDRLRRAASEATTWPGLQAGYSFRPA